MENPILKVLFTFEKNKVKCLLIGGQACIAYGAAEFSRDSDFVILCEKNNLSRLKRALKKLKAESIYVPEFKKKYLDKGHACHFRCKAKGVADLRIDIMSKMRGCDKFKELWKRRNRINLGFGHEIDVIGLSDLVKSKKTQRDKDWFMLKRLVENDILLNMDSNPPREKVKWWLLECRNPKTLFDLAKKYPDAATKCIKKRRLISAAIRSDFDNLSIKLKKEEMVERKKDIKYWRPLRKELEKLRHEKLKSNS
ncbi:hypothetical protein ACFL52_04835 [Candidatus Margulisiibacteriota bacterium]